MDNRVAEVPDRSSSGEGHFLSFAVGTETCAVALEAVQEIIRVPAVVAVPLSPPAVAGILNLRGRVLPVVSARRALGFPEATPGEQARVVVLNRGAGYGLLVDGVAGVIGGEAEPFRGEREGAAREFVSGSLHAGDRVVMLLDPERLGQGQFQSLAGGDGDFQDIATGVTTGPGEEEGFRYLTFFAADQEYGLPVETVREIGRLPAEMGRVPRAAGHLLGIAPLRGRLVPLVDLPLFLGLPREVPDDRRRVLVMGQGAPVGLVVDRVREVLRVEKAPEALPALWERADQSELQGMLSLEEGKRLVTVLAPERLLQSVLPEIDTGEMEGGAMTEEEARSRTGEAEDSETLVVFHLADQEFGLPVESVQEILRVPEEMSRVPGAEDFVEGMVNLRGRVLPVLDQRRRLGLAGGERSHRQRILVLEGDGGGVAGFAVDGVKDVLAVPRASLGAAPAMQGERGRAVRRVANLAGEGRMILVLDPDELLRGTETAPAGESS